MKNEVPQEFLVSDLVAAEVVTIIGSRRVGRPAQVLHQYFLDECEVEFVREALLREAMVHDLRYDGGLSIADCASLALMSRRGIRRIVPFDRDFDRARDVQRIH